MHLKVGPGLDADNYIFGAHLKTLRKLAGLSRGNAAAKLGFSAEYLRLIELGRRTPALGNMQKFLDVYGANGEIAMHGRTPDLRLYNLLDDHIVVEVDFMSRVREARRTTGPINLPSTRRATELGVLICLLAQADDHILREIREILEEKLE